MPNGDTIADVEAQIDAMRAAQRAHQTELQNAEQLEVQALTTEQRARDAQDFARRAVAENRDAIHFYSDEIDQLLTEWRALVPRQSHPVD